MVDRRRTAGVSGGPGNFPPTIVRVAVLTALVTRDGDCAASLRKEDIFVGDGKRGQVGGGEGVGQALPVALEL